MVSGAIRTTVGRVGFFGDKIGTVTFEANFHDEQSVCGTVGHWALTARGSNISGAPTLIVEADPSWTVTALASLDH